MHVLEAFCLSRQISREEISANIGMQFDDVCSLYPFIMATISMPCGTGTRLSRHDIISLCNGRLPGAQDYKDAAFALYESKVTSAETREKLIEFHESKDDDQPCIYVPYFQIVRKKRELALYTTNRFKRVGFTFDKRRIIRMANGTVTSKPFGYLPLS